MFVRHVSISNIWIRTLERTRWPPNPVFPSCEWRCGFCGTFLQGGKCFCVLQPTFIVWAQSLWASVLHLKLWVSSLDYQVAIESLCDKVQWECKELSPSLGAVGGEVQTECSGCVLILCSLHMGCVLNHLHESQSSYSFMTWRYKM